MSIKDRQYKQAKQEILMEYLKSGKYPEAVDIQQRLYEYFKERAAGLPRFNPTPVEEDTISNPSTYNEDLKDLQKDLNISFDELAHHMRRVISIANAYETEKRFIQLEIEDIENRIELLTNRFDNNNEEDTLSDSMKTFDLVDFDGDVVRGIPKTTTLVDLRHGQVGLENINTGGTKYNLSDAEYVTKINRGTGKGRESRPLTNALRDTVNEAWEYTVVSNQAETTEIQTTIDLGEILDITSVSIELHSPKPTEVKLFVADESEVYHEIIVKEGKNRIEWKLDEDVRYLNFVMIKNEPDYSHETEHEYYFGATNISAKKESYLPQGYFVSKPFKIKDKVINRLRLTTKDVIFPSTNIRYYIGLDTGTDMVEWQEVSPNTPVQLNRLTSVNDAVDSAYKGYGTKVFTNFGIDYYSISELDKTPEGNNIKIHMGDYMWQVDKILVTKPSGYQPSLEDWVQTQAYETGFLPIEKTWGTEYYSLSQEALERFTTYIYCEEDTSVTNNTIDIDTTSKATVYINNQRIKPIQNNGILYYTYKFQKGWNQIQILTYSSVAGIFRANLYLKDIAAMIYADKKPLERVSLYDLYNNTSKRNVSRFALDGNKIITNYNPKSLDKTAVGVRYYIEYAYASLDVQRNIELRFMAILSRDEHNDSTSPILKNYQIHIK